MRQSELRSKIEQAINSVSAENGSNTPDFILAEFLVDVLAAYDKSLQHREKWYGRPIQIMTQPPPIVDPRHAVTCDLLTGKGPCSCSWQEPRINPNAE